MRPFSSVNSPVYNEVQFSSKGFPTLSALIMPFSSVNCPLSNKDGSTAKKLHTFTAHVSFLQCDLRINEDKFWLNNLPHLYCLAVVWILWCWPRTEVCLKDLSHWHMHENFHQYRLYGEQQMRICTWMFFHIHGTQNTVLQCGYPDSENVCVWDHRLSCIFPGIMTFPSLKSHPMPAEWLS